MRELTTADEHTMSMKEIWRHFCFDNDVYCSLALFGNLVYRHVFTHSGYWASVTRVGETNNKKYNLRWMKLKPSGDDEQIDEFFSQVCARVCNTFLHIFLISGNNIQSMFNVSIY